MRKLPIKLQWHKYIKIVSLWALTQNSSKGSNGKVIRTKIDINTIYIINKLGIITGSNHYFSMKHIPFHFEAAVYSDVKIFF